MLANLPLKVREVFRLLAEQQLEKAAAALLPGSRTGAGDSGGGGGTSRRGGATLAEKSIGFEVLYQLAKDRFLVNNQQMLRVRPDGVRGAGLTFRFCEDYASELRTNDCVHVWRLRGDVT